jgi:outer membrane biosynthesis protein TonB
MRNQFAFAIALFVPISVSAQEVALFVETTYASEAVPVIQGPEGLTGRAARRYREQLQQQYEAEAAAAAQENVVEETVASSPVEVDPTPNSNPQPPTPTPTPTPNPQPPTPTPTPYPQPPTPTPTPDPLPPTQTQEQLDELTLEELSEYADEAAANVEEQLELLSEGFSVTSTSSLGSPLPATQRAAILRRTVRTVGQLRLFARALAEGDENLRKIELDDNSTTISYRKKAWLFGFLPLNYILEATHEDGVVRIDQPWWHVLSRDGVGELKDQLQEAVDEDENEPESIQDDLVQRRTLLEIFSRILNG